MITYDPTLDIIKKALDSGATSTRYIADIVGIAQSSAYKRIQNNPELFIKYRQNQIDAKHRRKATAKNLVELYGFKQAASMLRLSESGLYKLIRDTGEDE